MVQVMKGVLVAFCALATVSEAIAASGQNAIQCTLTSPASRTDAAQTNAVNIAIINASPQKLFAPWIIGTGFRQLLEWGVLSVSVKDEKGNRYIYGPLPAPFIPRQQSHYQSLAPGNSINGTFNLCWFRDDRHAASPCSRTGIYVVRAAFANDRSDYWDASTNSMREQSGVWTGEALCNEIKVDVDAQGQQGANYGSQTQEHR